MKIQLETKDLSLEEERTVFISVILLGTNHEVKHFFPIQTREEGK